MMAMSFVSVLQLMLPSFCLCVLMVGMLSYLGIHVIKREIIFVDLALAQIAALGTLIAFLLGIPLHTQASYWFSLALTAIAATVFTLSRSRDARVPQEAIIGLVYAIAAAVAIILIDKAPHGAQHIKDILTGSILWVKWRTVALVGVVYLGVGLFHFAFRSQFLGISEDVEAARARGLNVSLWDFLFYLSFGLVITVSVGSAGVLLVFVFLVAPAVMAVLITDRLLYQLVFGWGLGITATVTGLVVSYLADLSSGPLVIGAYAVALVLVSGIVHIVRAHDRNLALRRAALVAAGFAGCLAVLLAAGHAVGSHFGRRGHGHEYNSTSTVGNRDRHQVELDDAHAAAETSESEMGTEVDSSADPEVMFDESDDPPERADIVCRALKLHPAQGAALALRFLESDPPLFFGQTVVEALDAALGAPSGYAVAEPSDSPTNEEAAERVRSEFGLR
jgi:zinc/manganese transport system permease protein